MSEGESARAPVAGVTEKTGQYLERSAVLSWTTQKPTVPGLYWYRKSRDSKAYVVEVELDDDRLMVDDTSTDHCRGSVSTMEGEWAGPLLAPK